MPLVRCCAFFEREQVEVFLVLALGRVRVGKLNVDENPAIAQAFKAQSIPAVYALKDGEKCVGDLAGELGISVHNVSQHLRILRQRLLVRSRKEGQTVYYSITNPKFVAACALIREALVEEHQAEGESLQAARLMDSMGGTSG